MLINDKSFNRWKVSDFDVKTTLGSSGIFFVYSSLFHNHFKNVDIGIILIEKPASGKQRYRECMMLNIEFTYQKSKV